MPATRPPIGIVPFERLAIFIDGWNFKCATYDAFALQVDFIRLLEHFSQNAILLRAYYYIGEWDPGAIEWYIRLTGPSDPVQTKKDMEQQAESQRGFWRFLDRNGFKVVRKPMRVLRQREGRVVTKADLDLELAIDMLTIADKCEKQVLISGDGDFVPLVEAVQSRGVRVVVVSTQSDEAFRTAHYKAADSLLDVADEFIPIESIRRFIEREERRPRGAR